MRWPSTWSGKLCPRTAAAWSARLSASPSRSTRARTMLCTEPGTSSSVASSALRSNCSRNSGLPSARSMQVRAKPSADSTNSPARLNASSSRSGARSMVTSAVVAAWRHALSSGSPSMREVMIKITGPSAVAAAITARWSSVGASAQCRFSITTSSGWRALSRLKRVLMHSPRPRLRRSLSIASYIARIAGS